MVTEGLFVRMEAKAGHEMDVENMLREALPIVDDESGTLLWFALRFGPSTFGIFDAFPDDEARQAHLRGSVAQTLMERAPQWLAGEPQIEQADVLAAKLSVPAAAGAQQAQSSQ
jgi:quinol monooxygenase YgiN